MYFYVHCFGKIVNKEQNKVVIQSSKRIIGGESLLKIMSKSIYQIHASVDKTEA